MIPAEFDKSQAVAIFWFRRDLRLEDNRGLSEALNSGLPVLPIFIFDSQIIGALPKADARVNFIHKSLGNLNSQLATIGSGVLCIHGNPIEAWKELLNRLNIGQVYFNEDYEPYAINRDHTITELLEQAGVQVFRFKDQVIMHKSDVVKDDGKPYTVFTPYKRKWLSNITWNNLKPVPFPDKPYFIQYSIDLPSLESIGFQQSSINVKDFNIDGLDSYATNRDIPSMEGTSNLSPHLRFGTVGIRFIIDRIKANKTFLSELIWREFFMQILFHFPQVVTQNFKVKYDRIQWRNNPDEFERWRDGMTGYPLVDAGMRQLNETGYMHNRVRMVVASFLCKHLLIDWRWGEAYFAEKLLDYELSSNNGNWQWAASTGCDAVPYFRIFNPSEQIKRFDPKLYYIKTWVKDFESSTYPTPMVDHKFARERALSTYKEGLS